MSDRDFPACPHCGAAPSCDAILESPELVTYWGDTTEWWCDECDKTYLVVEVVTRYWELADE